MKKLYTKCTLLFLVIFCSTFSKLAAQPGIGISYVFTNAVGTTAYPAAAPNVNQIVPIANQNDFGYLFAPAGMSVRFAGVTYTQIVVSTNGWVALIPTGVGAVPASLSAGGYLNTNSLSTYNGGYPIIAPFWDDLATSQISYNFTGGALWVRWTAKIDNTNATAANLFWVKIDGATGAVSMYYSNAAYVITGSPTASIGIAGVCTGDYYSYNFPAAATYADSTIETSNIATRPANATYNFTPYQLYDNCANAKDLGPLTIFCNNQVYNINNAVTSGSTNCSTTDVADVWFKVTKPAGVSAVTVTTSPYSGCQPVAGTSVEVYSAPCGGGAILCSSTSTANPTFGEVTVSRAACVSEVLYIRVTADGDVGGKFNICAKDAGVVAGTGNTCAAPNWICSLPFNYSGTTAGAVDNYDSTSSACHSIYMNGEDYVFAYTPAANGCIKIDLTTANNNPGVFVYSGCPNSGGSNCLNSMEFSTGTGSISAVPLTAGQTYYIIVDNDTALGNTNISFNINITSAGAAPANDDCLNATPLGNIALGVTCTPQTFTTSCANPTPVGQAGVPSCIPPRVPAGLPPYFLDGVTGDVWLKFTAIFSGSLLISTYQSAVNPTANAAMAIYTGTCGSFGAPYACDYNSGPNGMPLLTIPVVNGTTYYIRVWSEHPENEGNFDICFQSNCAPTNDIPCAAVAIPLGATMSGNNTCAGSTSEPTNPAQCVAGGTVNTVWFSTVVPASGQVRVRTHPLTLTDTQIQGYTFANGCANAATTNAPKACNNDGTPCSGGSFFSFSDQLYTGLTPGETFYIAVDGVGSLTGSFEVSVIDGSTTTFPPVNQQDCGAAQQVCSTADIVVADPGFRNNGNICDLPGGTGCWAIGERNSVWYQFTVDPALTGGTANINFNITSAAAVDIDFLMWDITNSPNGCAAIQNGTIGTPTSCNFAAAGANTGISPGGSGYFSPTITFTGAPRTYVLLLNVYNSAANAGFTLDFTPTAGGPTPISPVSTNAVWTGLTDNLYATPTNWGDCGSTPSCAVDVTVVPTANGRQPNILAGPIQSVKNLVINTGATLTLQAGATLSVCGNFTNNGNLVCNPGSTIIFAGSSTQTISGNLTGANAFANLVITKPNPLFNAIIQNDIDVKENFTTTNANSVFSINGKYMKVGGNFSNANGTGTFTGISAGISGSTVEFNGAINATFTNTAGTINLNDVVMNKTAGKLTLTGPNSKMNIDSTLTLTSGNIVTTSLPALEVNMKYYLPAALIGGNANSYIEGVLRRKIANGISTPIIPATYQFPLGDPTVGFNNATITFTSATLVYDLWSTFKRFTTVPTQGPTAFECIINTYDALPIFNNGYWEFRRSTSAMTGNYNIALNNVGETNNTGAGWTVAKAANNLDPNLITSWHLLGNCVPASTAANTQRTSINSAPGGLDSTSFNHFYATAQSTLVLPIELLYFTAEPSGEVVICKWETASETNNDYFDVERSKDGYEFEPIGRVKGYGAGISSESLKYSIIDKELCEDIRYYRLKQVDIDGAFSYSKPVAIDCKRSNGIELYPNPADNSITYQFYYRENTDLVLNIMDISGRIVRHEKITVQKGINLLHALIDDLAAGAYTLRITGTDNSDTMLQTQFFKN